jgi:arginase
MMTRRDVVAGSIGVAVAPAVAKSHRSRSSVLILAPSNLGLRPNADGSEPGAWRAPDALIRAGLDRALLPKSIVRLPRPHYNRDVDPGTRIRNGHAIRRFSEDLAVAVAAALAENAFPIVVGGDCSVLLGCLLGARHQESIGLVHVDGHSDFYHPGNYDAASSLGSAAGMDLALATGRGEALLALWDGRPLVDDKDVVQIGERDELDADYDYRDIQETRIRRIPVRQVIRQGVAATAADVISSIRQEPRTAWLHVDLDVLDQSVMPAVDSPGSPGFDFAMLEQLVSLLTASGCFVGADFTIYNPELDAGGRYARPIVECIARGLSNLGNGKEQPK